MDLNLKFVTIVDTSKYKATIQASGKLGFSSDCNDYMDLNIREQFKIAFDVEGSKFTKIYLVDSKTPDNAAKVYKAGVYYSLKLSEVFKKMGIDYSKFSYTFFVEKSEEKYEGSDLFILTRDKTTPRKDGEE